MTGSTAMWPPYKPAIRYGQKCQTRDGKPSRWEHVIILLPNSFVAESTLDLKPYGREGSRWVSGPQFNSLGSFKSTEYGMLLHFPLSDKQRRRICEKAGDIINAVREETFIAQEGPAVSPHEVLQTRNVKKYTYPVSGLIGSMISFWLLDRIGLGKSNPLQSHDQLYCSAFAQECYAEAGIDFDPNHTARNTSPEIISQFDMPGLKRYPA